MTLTEILLKVKRENVCADCSRLGCNGPKQYDQCAWFGHIPNLPSVLVDKLPALEGTSRSTRVGLYLAALHASRRAFKERIRRALRKQLRPTDKKYETGERLYYK